MIRESPGKLPIIDDRRFELARWGDDRYWLLLRGFPDPGLWSSRIPPGPHLELLFLSVSWLALPTGWKSIALRAGDDTERSRMQERLGAPLHFEQHLFFLREGSTEHYVIAGGLAWAEIEPEGSYTLWSGGGDHGDDHPIGNVTYFYDEPGLVSQRREAWESSQQR